MNAADLSVLAESSSLLSRKSLPPHTSGFSPETTTSVTLGRRGTGTKALIWKSRGLSLTCRLGTRAEHHDMDQAIAYKLAHPETSYATLSNLFNIPSSTLHDRITGSHDVPGRQTSRNLSIEQEAALVDKINAYADQGTLLTPRNVKMLAEKLGNRRFGVNWTSTFIRRHSDKLSSRFYKIQDVARLKADTPLNRQAFYGLVKSIMDTGLYAPKDIYNVDESGFELNTTRKQRRVGHSGSGTRTQASLAAGVRITAVATMSTTDAIIPPLNIYPGEQLLEEWTNLCDDNPKMMAAATTSGYINSFIAMQWLKDVFDPYTKGRAAGARRLLFLDGHETHIKVDFLEACWARNIVCVIIPASLSSKFQPLDVNFFNSLKLAYAQQIDDFQLGTHAVRVTKGAFYRWFQRAWAEVATSRQIRAAWAESGLWPLNRDIMGVPTTPPPETLNDLPETPQTCRTLRRMVTAAQTGSLDTRIALEKLGKGYKRTLAEKVLIEEDLKQRRAAEELDEAARGGNKRTRFPQGQLFDQSYQEDHAQELAERKEAERQAKDRKRPMLDVEVRNAFLLLKKHSWQVLLGVYKVREA